MDVLELTGDEDETATSAGKEACDCVVCIGVMVIGEEARRFVSTIKGAEMGTSGGADSSFLRLI